MNLLSLQLVNFFSYERETISFQNEGIYLISGINKQTGEAIGVGKSAIKEAIKYATYGKCRLTPDDAIRLGQIKMGVQEDFSIGTTKYRIIRAREKNTKTGLRFIRLDDMKELTCRKNADTQELILNTVGLSYEQFMHSFCFGQSEFDDLKKLTPTKLIDFLKSVLSFDRFDVYHDKAKKLDEKITSEVNRMVDLKDVCNKVVDTKVNQKELNAKLQTVSAQIKEKGEKLCDLEKQETKMEAVNLKLLSSISNFEGNIKKEKAELTFVTKNKQCPLCKTKLSTNKKLVNSLRERINKMIAELEKEQGKHIIERKKAGKLFDTKEKLNAEWQLLKESFYSLKATLEEHLDSKTNKNLFDEKKYKTLLKKAGLIDKAVDVFSSKGLPLFVLNSYIPKLEWAINSELEQLINFKLELTTTKMLKSSSEIKDTCSFSLFRENKQYSLEKLSEGQEFLVTLGIRLGISKLYNNAGKFETLIIDGGFGELGTISRDKILDALDRLSKKFKKILVISHAGVVQTWTKPIRLFIKMDKNISKIKRNELNG